MTPTRPVRALFSLGLGAALSLALASCTQERCVSTACGSQTLCVARQINVVATATISFEDCASGACPSIGMSAGATIGPAYHPSERALRIDGGGAVQLRFVIAHAGSGQALVTAIRCDPGTTLTAGLSSLAPGGIYGVPSGPEWRRRRVLLRATDSTNVTGQTPDTVLVTLAAQGTGACEVDQVTLEGLSEYCTRYQTVVGSCESCERRTWDARDGGTWGPWFDAGSAVSRTD
ncbi:MAG: hypothetical protein U0325_21735 [Polyangiales bacterium]